MYANFFFNLLMSGHTTRAEQRLGCIGFCYTCTVWLLYLLCVGVNLNTCTLRDADVLPVGAHVDVTRWRLKIAHVSQTCFRPVRVTKLP